jgi:3-deoxy-D-manno-octulosonic-acid transferase
MLWLYRFLFLPALLVASPYYVLRMKRRGGYKRHFAHRFGRIDGLPEKRAGVKRIWLQAVSVGEMLAVGPILEALKNDRDVEVYLTTTTSTGYRIARERYQELTVGIGYFPLDWWLFTRRGWRWVKPDLVVLTEGERWPEHIHQAQTRGVPVLCINARLSDRSFRRMKKWRWASAPLIHGITRVLACSEHDAARFRELGFPPDRVITTGNIKLDLSIPLLTETEKLALRSELGFGREPVLLGSSIWPGEEWALLQTWQALRASGLSCRLLLVPRHAERRGDIEALLQSSGVSFHLRSRGKAPGQVDVAVADTTGELRRLTQLADLVFVGKSLPPHDEGQTPVEAAALGKAILFGPGMSNFRVIARELVAARAARRVENPDELTAVAAELFGDGGERAAMAEAAQQWHRANRGALDRTLAALREELSQVRGTSVAATPVL